MNNHRHQIVIVGGGAGGLELATRLGDKLGKKGLADVTLVDCTLTHIWKPLLHEVAAGTLDSHEDDLEYIAQAHWHHFRFRLGRMDDLDRANKTISLEPTIDDEGNEIIPRRTVPYDTLVLAVGSLTNDFGIPGVAEHCHFLDNLEQAEGFQKFLLHTLIIAQTQLAPLREEQLHIAIAGAGATGVELAAELHHATRQLVAYGLDRITPDTDIRLHIVEAADRVLPGLPERISASTAEVLREIGVHLHTGERITEATKTGFKTESGHFIPAEIKVWAAGIKAPDFLANIDGLETTSSNQLVVRRTLQSTRDDNIFAFGDCAACPQEKSELSVPPRAQAAHQQASMLYKSIRRRLQSAPLPEYRYKDYGSLINLSKHTTVGNLMGNLMGRRKGTVMIEGWMARMAYRSLYKMHQWALHGPLRVMLITAADLLTRPGKPRLKLH